MKKQIIMIAMLSVLTSATGCGADANVSTHQNATTSAITTTVGETTQTAATQDNTAAPDTNEGNNNSAAAPQTDNTSKGEVQEASPTNNGSYLFGGYVATQNDDLNMRKQPDTNSEVLEKIPNGTQLDIYSSDTSGWYQVTFKDKTGFVSADYIKKVEDYDGGAETDVQPNQYGFYPVIDPPASSISVASLAGTWKSADDIPETLDISGGADLYSGSFTWTGSDGYTITGKIRLEYLIDHDNRQFFYTFYEDNGSLWNAFGATGEVPLNDIYAGQSGYPHFTR